MGAAPPAAGLLSLVDYEAVGCVKVIGYIFSPISPVTEKMASGGPGGGNEPPGRRTEAATSAARMPCNLPSPRTPWVALDYASCGVAAWHPRGCSRSEDAGPDISIRRAAHSLRT